ncbi:MAG: hypothetical protein VW337_03515, partial [Gammaproteobacteria bacterium]
SSTKYLLLSPLFTVFKGKYGQQHYTKRSKTTFRNWKRYVVVDTSTEEVTSLAERSQKPL